MKFVKPDFKRSRREKFLVINFYFSGNIEHSNQFSWGNKMIEEIVKILNFIGQAFIHIWPYLVITIPLAVAVKLSGASKYIKRAFQAGPLVAIILATVVGAFSPFCSCGVIPVIAALLISGVPLAPVMSFWIASPSMDLEIFFLSVGTIGWNLAVWRLAGTLVLSLGAGFITHFAVQRQWIGKNIIKNKSANSTPGTSVLIKNTWQALKTKIRSFPTFAPAGAINPSMASACCSGNPESSKNSDLVMLPMAPATPQAELSAPSNTETCGCSEDNPTFRNRLIKESYNATLMVIKFMALAFFLEALIILYIPEEWIIGVLGKTNPMSIMTAAFLGIPVYTSNLSALPMISGLLKQGMEPAAALAFLIAGPTTTLPAMAAVWTLVVQRVFILYVSFALFGAVLLGYVKLFTG